MKYTAPSLNDCDKEPIHVIGHIQSYGYILVLNKEEFVVEQVSENIEALLGVSVEEVLGNPVDYFFPFSFLDHFNNHFQNSKNDDHYSLSFELNKKEYILTTHGMDDRLILEVEPDNPANRQNSHHKYADLVDNLAYDLDKPDSLDKIYEMVLDRMHPILGFDRMMIYRFDADDHGEVVGERASNGKQKFLGLKFPNTDIPKQARKLYLENNTRGIYDVNDTPVAVTPALRESDQKPLDLTYSFLRSVSPIHVSYLKNMGITSSFSISILVRNKLWGMILCHHETGPLRLDIHQRRSASFIGNILSQKISSITESYKLKNLRERLSGMRGIISGFVSSEDLHHTLQANQTTLINNFKAHDYALFYDDKVSCSDSTINKEWVMVLREQLAQQNSNVVSSSSLSTDFSELKIEAKYPAGALALRLSKELNEYLILLRKEQVQTVDWAGKPQNPSDKKLSPRNSFEKWTEEVKGQSKIWEEDEVIFAEELRMQLIESIISVSNRNTKSPQFEFRKRLEERNLELENKNRELMGQLEKLRKLEAEYGITKEVLQAKNNMHTLKNVRKKI